MKMLGSKYQHVLGGDRQQDDEYGQWNTFIDPSNFMLKRACSLFQLFMKQCERDNMHDKFR